MSRVNLEFQPLESELKKKNFARGRHVHWPAHLQDFVVTGGGGGGGGGDVVYSN